MTHPIPPVLTIAIPTFCRARYLEMNLRRLLQEMPSVPSAKLEVLVADNHSTDATPQVVTDAVAAGLPVRYLRNFVDIGSDANIAQCFNEARGDYVQILGDDDLYVTGTLARVIAMLESNTYGVLCLRPFGYERDAQREYPGVGGRLREFSQAGKFLSAIGPLVTFISATLINRRIQANVDARDFCGSNLVQVHLVVNAALMARQNAFMTEYMLACKRSNSGGYDFSEVFVERLGRILDTFRLRGLRESDIQQFETRMLMSYHPFYLFRQRLSKQGNLHDTRRRFKARFGRRALFRMWVAPIIFLPRPMALGWGAFTTATGRLLNGELRRGLAFMWHRLKSPG